MLPTPSEFANLFDHMLTNTPQGNPRKVNMYKTHGYFAEMPLKPLAAPERQIKLFSKTLKVTVTLSEKGHLSTWRVFNPKADEIIKAIRSIQNGIYHSYMILSIPDKSYIQTNIRTLEYRDVSEDEHYYCSPEFLSTMTILKAFLSYSNECNWWKESIYWKKGFGP